jgi:MscS family membrane protein
MLLLGLGLWCGLVATGRAQAPDDKQASPQATVRSFLRAASFARESPKYIKAAIDCLELDSTDHRDPGLLATHLEAILRARDIDTDSLPDKVAGSLYVLLDTPGFRIALRCGSDGRWLFDQDTVAQIPKMYAEIQKQLQERNKEAAALDISPEFASARATFRTFLKAMFRGDTDTALRCLDLEEVPAVARQEVGLRVACKLKQIILRHRLIVYQEMPDTNYSDPYLWLSQGEGAIELVRRPNGANKGEWVFSRATVRSSDDLFDAFEAKPYRPEILASKNPAIYPDPWRAPDLWLRGQLPDWLKVDLISVAGVHLQRYEVPGYALLLLLAYAVARLATALLIFVVRRRLAARRWDVPRETVARRLRWTGWFLGLAVLRWGVLVLAVNKTVLIALLTVVNPLFLLLALLTANGLIDLVGDLIEARHATTGRATGITQMLWPVGSLVIKITLLLCTVYRLMAIFSWDVSTLLAGLGIGGLAFALGAQDSLKNLFGSFTLIADRPFVVGETVRIGGEGVGKVEYVGLRSTRIRTADDTLLIVPNSNLTTMNITNYGRRRYHHYTTKIAVVYATPLDRLTAFRDGIRDLIRQQPWTRKDNFEVAINDLDSSAVAILVDVYFEASDQVRELDARGALILAILRLAETLHIQLAFPTQTVHLVPPVSETPAYTVPEPQMTAGDAPGYTKSRLRASA